MRARGARSARLRDKPAEARAELALTRCERRALDRLERRKVSEVSEGEKVPAGFQELSPLERSRTDRYD